MKCLKSQGVGLKRCTIIRWNHSIKNLNSFELWSDMEIKYAEQLSKGKSKNKEVLRALIAERKKYKEQLNRIRIDLQGIMSSIKSQKLKPNLT